MSLLTKIIIVVSAIVTVFPFVLYGIHTLREGSALREWRDDLIKGMNVIVDDGKNIYKATIITVNPGWVRVITDSGNTAGVPNRNIYPLNYVIDERDMHSPGDHLPGERGKTDEEAV